MPRTIEGLETPILDIMTGKSYRLGESDLTVKRAMLQGLVLSKCDDGMKAFQTHKLALKLSDANGSITLDDLDYMLLKKSIESNASGWFAPIHAALFEKVM